jgi:hypothetical protein
MQEALAMPLTSILVGGMTLPPNTQYPTALVSIQQHQKLTVDIGTYRCQPVDSLAWQYLRPSSSRIN